MEKRGRKSKKWKGTRYQNKISESTMIGLQGSTMWQKKACSIPPFTPPHEAIARGLSRASSWGGSTPYSPL
uniref:Uncharacterized protein n=1 Tax=Oryza punctata TaxID=4537 RepID=A0A0E0KKG4_ORYPU